MEHTTRYTLTDPNVVHETIDGETVILKLDTGVYYSLNEFGAFVWSLLARGFSVDEIAAACADGFDGPPDSLDESARRLVADLEREDLVAVDDGSGAHDLAPVEYPIAASAHASRRPFRVPAIRKYDDMRDLLLIDPFHDVPAEGWPEKKVSHTSSEMLSSPVAAS